MIDIGNKKAIKREAKAEGFIRLKESTLRNIRDNDIKKGGVDEASKVAGILGAKLTPNAIPHCHPIPLESVEPSMKVEEDGVRVTCTVKARYKTGVEMESLMCVNSMLLTVWDMVKYLEKDDKGQYRGTEISGVRVLRKLKG
ncbi:MAG: cyclic pyranopterin monophosphate synthase MoaC [Candidatus Thermoplasmatota archaeon]|jgi:cyclic pyranopterin phosphate synthase|nr:cyclic pyranopterin monophosphate synthase MoaC [Candidatus Thermoplasmatota archaeon]